MDFVPAIFPIIVFGKEYFVSRQKKEFEEYEINESYKTEERDNPYGFKRKSKEERPVLAICYDFDKTLSPGRYAGTGLYSVCELSCGPFLGRVKRDGKSKRDGFESCLYV